MSDNRFHFMRITKDKVQIARLRVPRKRLELVKMHLDFKLDYPEDIRAGVLRSFILDGVPCPLCQPSHDVGRSFCICCKRDLVVGEMPEE